MASGVIETRVVRHLFAGGTPDNGVGSLSRRQQSSSDEGSCDGRDDIGVGKPRMDGVEAPIGLSARHLTNKKHVGKFGYCVIPQSVEGAGLVTNAGEVDPLSLPVDFTAYLGDPRSWSKGAAEMVGEHEVAEMVGPEMDLKAVFGDPSGGADAGVVHQHVDRSPSFFEGPRRGPRRLERCKIEMEKLGRPPAGEDFANDCLGPLL